CQHSYGLPYTF
nr:immunoglobulin light chain junction region [Macaca mulatta]MOW08125.1 immunoglobulin light chain junction region [Macaca mulatta]MOW08136.1 immunoglobulin light chain junction region [Macaca mulatta]MOW08251.1 immunoglobulin light chain junction region [Macaca mulatta]MOW08634.1 immunoglobulin light chain junction region [Macaca mulatta]